MNASTTSAHVPDPPAFSTYLNMIESPLCTLASVLTISLDSRLLYYGWFQPTRLRVRHLSSAMWLYLAGHTLAQLANLPYMVYLTGWWRPRDANIYNPYAIFWLGLANVVYMAVSPVPILFLTLDRCLALQFEWGWRHQVKNWIFHASWIALVALAAATIYTSLAWELPLDVPAVIGCQVVSCVMHVYHAQFSVLCKSLLESVNLLLAIYFLQALRRRTAMNGAAAGATVSQQKERRVKNRLMSMILWLEITLNVVPLWCGIAYTMAGRPVAEFFTGLSRGPVFWHIGTLCTSANGVLCAIFYTKTLLGRREVAAGHRTDGATATAPPSNQLQTISLARSRA